MKPLFISLVISVIVSCANTRNAVADFLVSPTNSKIIAVASQAGSTVITNSTGKELTDEQNQMLNSAITPLLFAAGRDAAAYVSAALRSKQGTSHAANPAALAQAITSQSGVAVVQAKAVADSVGALQSSGVPANIANEAVAVSVDNLSK